MFIKIDGVNVVTASSSRKEAHYVALVAQPDGEVALEDYGEAGRFETQLNHALSKFRNAGELELAPQLESMTDLYELIWSRVAKTLAPFTVVYVVGEGPISLTPFPALRNKEGQFLIENNKRIFQLTSPLDVVEGEPVRTNVERNALVIGDPAFGPAPSQDTGNSLLTFEPMKSGKTEVEVVDATLNGPTVIRTDKDATKEQVRALARSSRFVHFATHGFFLDDKFMGQAHAVDNALLERGHDSLGQEIEMVRSGIALAGANFRSGTGILTALEIAGMDFSATKLVTLSACETGLGVAHDDEGVFGLRLAFQVAGAKNLIMSLWDVSSNELVRQMKMLYHIIESGDLLQWRCSRCNYKESNGIAAPCQMRRR
jgi:CHAT domain-containing protein